MTVHIAPIDKSIDDLAKLLLFSLVAFAALANVPSLFPDGKLWLKSTFPVVLLTVAILYLGGIALRKYGKSYLEGQRLKDYPPIAVLKLEKVTRLHFGVLGGLLGVCSGGIIAQTIVVAQNEWCPPYLLAVCGSFGGLGFVLLTKGNRRRRGLIGCVFALLAIIFGIMLCYLAPIIIGHKLGPSGEMLSPIYIYNNVSFLEYFTTALVSLNGMFYTFIGLLVTFLGSNNSFFGKSTKMKEAKITANQAAMLA